jgi:EAL domain-containing protein (putative c-di-GMP-specific phosphodiesterase class I)
VRETRSQCHAPTRSSTVERVRGLASWIGRSAIARPFAFVALAVALLVAFPALRLITGDSGWMLFSVIPIVLLAMMYGLDGGLGAAGASSAAYLAFALTGEGAGATEDIGAPVGYFILGLITGIYANGALGDFDLRARVRRAELRDAIRQGQIVLHYQPLAETRSRAVVALEGLARWEHPTRGLLAPSEFISLAEGDEQTIWELTVHVADQALADATRMWDGGDWPVVVAINVSAANLDREELAGELAGRMSAHGCPPGHLMVELTETAVASSEAAISALLRLREMGIAVALDDFGSGQSSLTRLAELPLDAVKVDLASFSETTPDASTREQVIRGVVELSHALGLAVVAEQIEHQDQENLSEACGVDVMQGYRLSRALPPDELRAWLAETSTLVGITHGTRDLFGWLRNVPR